MEEEIEKERPILGAGASVGIIGKCAELGGADLILVYSTGLSRIRGLPTTMIPNSNEVTLGMFDEIDEVVEDTPIVAGVEPYSILKVTKGEECELEEDLETLIEKFTEKGFSGIINFPTSGFVEDEETRGEYVERGGGFAREVEMIRTAGKMNVFTMAYTWYPKDAEAMAEADVDVLVPHCGITAGGEAGPEAKEELEKAAERVQEMIDVARDIKPDLLCLSHGGPIATPEDAKYIYEHTDAQGFVGASSIERLPVEKAVKDTCKHFKEISLEV